MTRACHTLEVTSADLLWGRCFYEIATTGMHFLIEVVMDCYTEHVLILLCYLVRR